MLYYKCKNSLNNCYKCFKLEKKKKDRYFDLEKIKLIVIYHLRRRPKAVYHVVHHQSHFYPKVTIL